MKGIDVVVLPHLHFIPFLHIVATFYFRPSRYIFALLALIALSSTDFCTKRPDSRKSGVLVPSTNICSSVNDPNTAFVCASNTVHKLGYDLIKNPATWELYVSGFRK